MWGKFREGLQEFYEVAWVDSTWRGKVSMLFGIIIGVIAGSAMVHGELAKNGCSVSVAWYQYLYYGMVGIAIALCGFAIGGLLVRWIIDWPRYLKDRRASSEQRRKDRKAAREYGKLRKARLGYRYISPETSESIKFWTVLITVIVVGVAILSITAGYLWWLAFC